MIDILVIEKSGKVKGVSLKKCVPEEFYKKAGFKKADGFNCLHTWKLDEFNGNEYPEINAKIIRVITFLIKASNGVIGIKSPKHPQFSESPKI